jgi:hypothetical protein
MRTFPLVAGLLAVAFAAPAAVLAEDKCAERWEPLIKGDDLQGWQFHMGRDGTENEGTFRMENDTLIISGRPGGYMYTKQSYDNYTLAFELAFKRPDGLRSDDAFRGNSGVLIHLGEPNALGIWPRSIEVQGMNRQMGLILPIPRDLKCKLTYDKQRAMTLRKPLGQFNQFKIEVEGGDMVIELNGEVVSTVSDCELTEGPIGLQSEGAETHWRNLRILEK